MPPPSIRFYFDADQIVALAKSAVCGTWSSPPNTTTALPCIIQRLTATTYTTPPVPPRCDCRTSPSLSSKAGLKFGLYYSQDLDWHRTGWRRLQIKRPRNSRHHLGQQLGLPGRNTEDFDRCFNRKILPQIKEIMTNYGDIATAWFDVPMTLSEAQSQTIYDTVRALQLNCLINSRLG